MNVTVRAIYQGGVLRPTQPLALDEGEAVDVTIGPPKSTQLYQDDVSQRIQAAATIAEWVEATKLLPADDGGYDIVKALNENRVRSGGQPLIPDDGARP